MKKIKVKYDREFQGVLITGENYKEMRDSGMLKFHQKHLNAYKKGHNLFFHGTKPDGTPEFHYVQQNLTVIN